MIDIIIDSSAWPTGWSARKQRKDGKWLYLNREGKWRLGSKSNDYVFLTRRMLLSKLKRVRVYVRRDSIGWYACKEYVLGERTRYIHKNGKWQTLGYKISACSFDTKAELMKLLPETKYVVIRGA